MAQLITLTLTPKQAADSSFYTAAVARQMGIKQSDIALLRIVKRSVDARRGALKVNLTLEAFSTLSRCLSLFILTIRI